MKIIISYDTAIKLAQYLSKGKTTEDFFCEIETITETILKRKQECQIIVRKEK